MVNGTGFFKHSVRIPAQVGVTYRVLAKVFDIIIVFLSAQLIAYPAGPLIGFVYSLLGDAISWKSKKGSAVRQSYGQSFGKKIIGIQVVSTMTQKPIAWKDSLLRNLPVGLATFFAMIPVWGWIFLALVGLPLMVMEVYLMFTADAGHRLGDVMADTEVIEVPRRLGV
jgi:uncharacterized RDD family membrane protein YckC